MPRAAMQNLKRTPDNVQSALLLLNSLSFLWLSFRVQRYAPIYVTFLELVYCAYRSYRLAWQYHKPMFPETTCTE